jgi:hemerythrin-like domain-containing protein
MNVRFTILNARGGTHMNGLELLKSDHHKIAELFEMRSQATSEERKRELLDQIQEELSVHSQIEESVFYPIFAERKGFEDLIEDSYDEHQEMKDLIAEIENADDENEMEDLVDELQEAVEHHVEEEENELFPEVRKAVSENELNELGTQLQDARQTAQRAA